MSVSKLIGSFGISLVLVSMLSAQDQAGITVPDAEYPDYTCSCSFHSDTEGTLLLGPDPFHDSGKPTFPSEAVLLSNYPNPFNPSTTIRFELPYVTDVQVSIYNLRGQEVIRLGKGSMVQGYHHLVWDGRDQHGRSVPGGIYVARLVTPDYAKSIRIVLLK
jgi:hypothetical protein